MVTSLLISIICFLQSSEKLDKFSEEIASMTINETIRLADNIGPSLDKKEHDAVYQKILVSQNKELLFWVRVQAYAEKPKGQERIISLLKSGDNVMVSATLQTLSLKEFYGNQEVFEELENHVQTIVAEQSPELWTSMHLCLIEQAPAKIRRQSLRELRKGIESNNKEIQRKSILALGRSSTPLNETEHELLQTISRELSNDAQTAKIILEKIEQKNRFRAKVETLEELLAAQNLNFKSNKGDLDVLEELIIRVQKQHMEGESFSREELINAAADGLLRRLDPHSTFLSGSEYEEFLFDMNQAYGGIGAYVNTVDGFFTITRPIYSGPAYAAGLLSEDRILSVDGWSTKDQSNDEIIKRLKGEPGTTVVLEVFRRGWLEAKPIEVERATIQIPTVRHDILPGKILYIELLSFSSDVARRLYQVITEAQTNENINGVVLDMRNNPGGYLSEAVSICDLFLPKNKLVVTTKSRTGKDKEYRTRARALIQEDIPLSILINEYSASASEIVSGALSIHGRATTVGARTYGKGSVQNLLPMSTSQDEPFRDSSQDEPRNGIFDPWEEYQDKNKNGKYDYGDRIKLTIAYYYLPDGSTIHTQRDYEGRVIQEGGVTPDIEASFSEVSYIEAREISHLLETNAIQDYAKRLMENFPSKAVQLAINDMHKVSEYPEWENFYQETETQLDSQIVRKWVRRQLRTLVSDSRGKVFPGNGFYGDYVEDPVLRMAIQTLLKETKLPYESLPEYSGLIAQIDD